MLAFIDTLRAEGHTVESIIRVLQEQGVKIAARTYRAWKRGRVSARTITDAMVVDAVRDLVWTTVALPDGTRKRKMTPVTDAEYATAAWVEWYNRRRLQSSLGMVFPAMYEDDYYTAQTLEPCPA